MGKSGRKKLARIFKPKFWRRGLQKIKKALLSRKRPVFLVNILKISVVSLLALAAIAHNEYSFWSKIETSEKGKIYFFSAETPGKIGETPKREVVPDLKIAILADAHTGIQFGHQYLQKFVTNISSVNPDLIIDGGDLIESRINYIRLSKKDAQIEFTQALGIINISYPIHHAIGNHEVFSLDKNDVEFFTGEKSYYNFNFKGYNVIILDTNFTLDGKDIEPANPVPGADRGFMPDTEKEWLKSQLKGNNQNIIFSHHPLYNLKNSADLINMLKTYKHKIIMTANGHKHKAETRIFGGVTNYDMPSLWWQEGEYGIVEIYGTNEKVTFVDLE
jgi:hypothetical protein